MALVIPSLNNNNIKTIEAVLYGFLWNYKPDKVRREDARLPQKIGGISMICLTKFWQAFKFSWIRRALTTKAVWPCILQESIKIDANIDLDLVKTLESGASALKGIGKKLKNPFWSEVFSTIEPILEGAIFCTPEKMLLATFSDNPLIKRRNKPINRVFFQK